MGFVEVYTIVVFCIGVALAAYYTGAGGMPRNDDPPLAKLIYRWIGMLPLVGRVFGWW